MNKKKKVGYKKKEGKKLGKTEEKEGVNLSEIEKEVKKAEKEIKETEFGIEEDFQEFFETPTFEKTSPSLKRINTSPINGIRLEEDLSEELSSSKEGNNDSFKYDVGRISDEEPKYQRDETTSISNILPRTEIEKFERTGLFERQEIGFIDSQELRAQDSTRVERYNPASRMDKEKLGKEDFPKEREIKYRPLGQG
jgi:hypothetical protein